MENLRVLSDCNAIMILDAGEKEKSLSRSILDCHVILGIHCLQKVCEPRSVTKESYIFHTGMASQRCGLGTTTFYRFHSVAVETL